MNQKEKQLLIKDLCARLLYGVICRLSDKSADVSITEKLGLGGLDHFIYGTMDVLPYLRPISSMTEDEMDKLFDVLHIDKDGNDEDWIKINDALGIKFFFPTGKWVENVAEAYDYLNSIHIDYRGLIEKGLALEAPEGMYKIE